MSARLKRNRLCLCLLAKTDPALARFITEKGNGNLVRSLCERAHNILTGTDDIQDWVSDDRGRTREQQQTKTPGVVLLARQATVSIGA